MMLGSDPFLFKLIFRIYTVALIVLALVSLVMSGCSVITDGDRQLAERVLHDSTGCLYIQGSGGAGAGAIPAGPVGVPIGGGYGQGSLTAARSNSDNAKVKCGPEGASVE